MLAICQMLLCNLLNALPHPTSPYDIAAKIVLGTEYLHSHPSCARRASFAEELQAPPPLRDYIHTTLCLPLKAFAQAGSCSPGSSVPLSDTSVPHSTLMKRLGHGSCTAPTEAMPGEVSQRHLLLVVHRVVQLPFVLFATRLA